MSRPAITIKDVARQAGVSVATVSRVFNGGPVRDATRRRVRAVAERLRYSPNSAARSLSTRRTRTLGVLLPDLHGEFFSEVIRGIDQTAQQRGYHLLVSSSHDTRSDVRAALQAMRGRVDGLIVMSPQTELRALIGTLPEVLPVVLLNCAVEATAHDVFSIDNYGGAHAVTRHLLAHGHERIALIGGPAGNHDAGERRRGWEAALREAGIAPDPALVLPGDFTEEGGYRAIPPLLELEPRPTAVFAANDSMGIGAMCALREAGVRVPEEVALVGFDDIPIARYVTPSLSSVHVSIAELGARATDRLLHAVASENRHERVQATLETRLVPRASCGCAPGAGEGVAAGAGEGMVSTNRRGS